MIPAKQEPRDIPCVCTGIAVVAQVQSARSGTEVRGAALKSDHCYSIVCLLGSLVSLSISVIVVKFRANSLKYNYRLHHLESSIYLSLQNTVTSH